MREPDAVPPLSGYTAGLTAEWCAEELSGLLTRQGAAVVAPPTVRLLDAAVARQVDVLTFTGAPSAADVLRIAERSGRLDSLVDALHRRTLVAACVDDDSAGPLAKLGVPVVRSTKGGVAALVGELAFVLPARAVRLRVGPSTVELRGQAALVDGEFRPVPRGPMAVLRALAAQPGRVVSRPALSAVLPAAGSEHAVEAAIARLRAALGEPRLVQTVVKRGYRLATDPVAALR
ncbi:MAG TPA: winged helix-turn-helix domain-containing protein [Pseudonocardiaceae bacterium]|jgi:uroporphyrinogen-III synthase